MPSYGWAMVTKNVHQLKLLQLSKFDDRSPTMVQLLQFIKIIHDHVVITIPTTDKKWSNDYFPGSVPAVQFHNRGPFVTDDIKICQSYMTALS